MDIIMSLHDMSKVDELNKYGEVVYVSQYTNMVGMSCTKHDYHKIKKLSERPSDYTDEMMDRDIQEFRNNNKLR